MAVHFSIPVWRIPWTEGPGLLGHKELDMTEVIVGKKKKMVLTQSCLTLCDPMDCSLPGPSVHRIL